MTVKKVSRLIGRIQVMALMLVLSTSFSTQLQARQLDDVTVPDSVTIVGTDVPLQLNGMGYRTKLFFKIYLGALYTESKVNSRDAVQALQGPKRVLMHMIYDEVSHDKMADAWKEGFEDNTSDEQMDKLQSRLKTFISFFPDLKKGNIVLLDYIPVSGTRVTIDGIEKGMITGADFYSALLDVWLGKEPADEDLKEAMSGIDQE
ncbi:MAG: chalcone isomerase family protein [Gammaproteobacteria bacterium]|nr:chalcone isomerase family protein [Gammaproteobacteria bacterium]